MNDQACSPAIQPGERVVLFDGVCKLCNGWVRFVIRHDRARRIRLASMQSVQGQALLVRFGLPTEYFDSMAYIEHGRLFLRSDAVLRIVAQFPWPWRALGILRLCPGSVRDWCYDRIARNRYRLFGRYDQCLLPTPDHDKRFLED